MGAQIVGSRDEPSSQTDYRAGALAAPLASLAQQQGKFGASVFWYRVTWILSDPTITTARSGRACANLAMSKARTR
jgi:hypothetical protein